MPAQISLQISGDWMKGFAQDLIDQGKAGALIAANEFMEAEVRSGRFQPEKSKRVLFLRNRGREAKWRYENIRADKLRLPFQLRWVDTEQGLGQVREAVLFAMRQLLHRSPVVSGDYVNDFRIVVNYVALESGAFRRLPLESDDVIYIVNISSYAAVLERGFARDYYQTRSIPGGIMRPVAKQVRKAFPGTVSCEFQYPYMPELNWDYPQLPGIRFAAPGVLAGNDAKIPTQSKRRDRAVSRGGGN